MSSVVDDEVSQALSRLVVASGFISDDPRDVLSVVELVLSRPVKAAAHSLVPMRLQIKSSLPLYNNTVCATSNESY